MWENKAKLGLLLNNTSKCFNNFIKGENREQLIIILLEVVKTKIMVRIHEKRDKMLKHIGLLCPKVHNNLGKPKNRLRYKNTVPNSGENFNINRGNKIQFIDLEKCTYNYYEWDLNPLYAFYKYYSYHA